MQCSPLDNKLIWHLIMTQRIECGKDIEPVLIPTVTVINGFTCCELDGTYRHG